MDIWCSSSILDPGIPLEWWDISCTVIGGMAPQNLTLNHQFSENHKIGVPTSLETLISTKDISLSLFWMIFWIILVQAVLSAFATTQFDDFVG